MIKSKGYSLLELFTVLALIGILCCFSLPISHYFFSAKKIEIIGTEIRGMVRFARTYALVNNETYILKPISMDFNWSKGVELIEASTKKLIYQWHWATTKINIKWSGFHSNDYLSFAPDLRHAVVNGHFTLSDDSNNSMVLTINRIGHIH